MADMTTPQNLPFSLQEGESITETIKPQQTGFYLKNGIGYVFGIIFVAVFDLIISAFVGAIGGFLLGVLAFIVILILYAGFAYLMVTMSYGKYNYWITNQRVIGSRGVIGYSTDSLPLEMIADVVVNRDIVDRILNLSTLFIMPVGGAGMMYGGRGGGMGLSGTNYLQALTQADAMRIQKDILDARNKRKKEISK